jgi:translation initiation factor 4E
MSAEDQQPVQQNQGESEGAPDFNVKHPLEHSWTLWFDNPQQRQDMSKFGQTLRPVFTFNTVEDFWWCVPGSVALSLSLWPCLLSP